MLRMHRRPAEILYAYPTLSRVEDHALRLSTNHTGHLAPCYFDGFLERPDVAAAGLLAVARVARSRFFMAAATLAPLLDPVFTVEPGGLHVEGFSGCGGVHARLDITPAGLDERAQAYGTVNVDFNENMRAGLASLRRHEPLRLMIGDSGVAASTLDTHSIERRVGLPERWMRGFAEVQVASAGLEAMFELDAPAARRFVRELPSGRAATANVWLTRTPGGFAVTTRRHAGRLWLSASERLGSLRSLQRQITRITVYGRPDSLSSSVWLAELSGDMQLLLTLSPERTRGFSGEGGLLYHLANRQLARDSAAMMHALAGRWRWSVEDLVTPDWPRDRVRDSLERLGANGNIAWDPLNAQWFRRQLPFASHLGTTEPPRLLSARALVAARSVQLQRRNEAIVTTHNGPHTATLNPPGCNCRWWNAHPGDRGPCKHILALYLTQQQSSAIHPDTHERNTTNDHEPHRS